MVHYHPLETVKYQHDYDPNFSLDAEYQQRLANVSAVVTSLYPLLSFKNSDKQTKKYPIFFVYTPKMINLCNRFILNSRKIEKASMKLPNVALGQFLDSLLLGEITYTNSIEGIKTDAAEISTIIRSIDVHPKGQEKRLWSTIRMYQEIQKGQLLKIESLQNFRNIYDELLKGEIPAEKQPNGQLFRDKLSSGILTIGTATKTVHVPPVSELDISEALSSLIAFMNKDDLPAVYKALITHFFFENTHPFLDGNGRMGRYLLSTYLSSKYDRFTGFSVATAIHAQISSYYRIFKETDKAENRAELTFFIEEMLQILTAQQDKVLENLITAKNKLDHVKEVVSAKAKRLAEVGHNEKAVYGIMFYLAESKLFTGDNPSLGIQDREIVKLISAEGTSQRKIKQELDALEEAGFIKKIASRPKQHILAFELN